MSEQSIKYFISYARADSEFVLKLAKDLRGAGADIWMDQLDILPGERWDIAVQRAVENCPRILVILSPTAVQSNNVMDEVSYALEEKKVVIPVLYLDCKVPLRLHRLQRVDFVRDYGSGFSRLTEVLGISFKKKAGNNSVPESPLEILKKAIEAGDISIWNNWKSANHIRYPDLSGADLSGADLSGANLGGAKLIRAKLTGANLSRANIRVADLSGAELERANLTGAWLNSTELVGADFTGADLTGANLSGANLDGAKGLLVNRT